ncbi:MAG: hypothetical protein IKW98_01505 [Prevotella sp.]|nr:hypothetical protein [Prevotella sp.]
MAKDSAPAGTQKVTFINESGLVVKTTSLIQGAGSNFKTGTAPIRCTASNFKTSTVVIHDTAYETRAIFINESGLYTKKGHRRNDHFCT